ncbi:MAG: response regulator [Phycisphaeraceae bacterium]
MSQNEILIVDNDEGVCQALATRLEDAGYTCKTASSGAQGLALFQHGHIGLVITDMNMPHGDGASLIQSIRKQADTPIVVVSGFYNVYEQDLANYPGVTLFKKPFEAASLIDLVEVEFNTYEKNKAA